METKQIDFSNAYLERCDKETENLLSEEGQAFLAKPIKYLITNKNEFIYIESTYFNDLGVDALSIEIDDVFGTFDVMLGLKLPKKKEAMIQAYLQEKLKGEEDIKFDLMFDQNDGLWNVNFTFNFLEDFHEEMTFQEAFSLIYQFLSGLVEEVK